jgi:cellobiose phosphorylase
MAMEQGGAPRAQVLSNGRMAVVVAGGGGGSARLERVVLARWSARGRPEAGALAFVRESASGHEWPAGLAPGGEPPDEYALEMTGGTAALRRVDGDLVTTVDVCVSPFDDVELRRVTVLNRGEADRRLEVGTRRELLPVRVRGGGVPPPGLEVEVL